MKKAIFLFLIILFAQACNFINDNKTDVVSTSPSMKLSKEYGVFKKEFVLVNAPKKSDCTIELIEAWSENLWFYSNRKGDIKSTSYIDLVIRFNNDIINDSMSFFAVNKNLGKRRNRLLIPISDNEDSVSFYLNIDNNKFLYVLKAK